MNSFKLSKHASRLGFSVCHENEAFTQLLNVEVFNKNLPEIVSKKQLSTQNIVIYLI